jgi:hypothetical protein
VIEEGSVKAPEHHDVVASISHMGDQLGRHGPDRCRNSPLYGMGQARCPRAGHALRTRARRRPAEIFRPNRALENGPALVRRDEWSLEAKNLQNPDLLVAADGIRRYEHIDLADGGQRSHYAPQGDAALTPVIVAPTRRQDRDPHRLRRAPVASASN